MAQQQLRKTLLYGTALLCCLAPLLAPPASAETLMRKRGEPVARKTFFSTPQPANPYQLRRQQARAQVQAPTRAAPETPAMAQAVQASEPERLRVVIPNMHTAQQARHPSSLAVITPSSPQHPYFARSAAPVSVASSMMTSGPTPAQTRIPAGESGSNPENALALLEAVPAPVRKAFAAAPPPPAPPPVITVKEAAEPVVALSVVEVAREEPPPPAPVAAPAETAAPVEIAKAEPKIYHSPGIIIEKTAARTVAMAPAPRSIAELTPEGLAALAPSAGEPAAPLIALPETVPSPPPVAPSPAVAAPPVTPLLDANPPPASSTPPVVVTVPASEPAPAETQPEEMQEEIVTVAPEEKTSAPEAEAPLTPESSEPVMDLSQQSKAILKKIPSNLDGNKKSGPAKLDIDHAKDTSELLKPEEPPAEDGSVRHESMGIKIEVKKRQANINYELEKAYNALIAGQATEAIEIYRNVLDSEPNNKNALFGLATTYHRAGQIEQARPLYAKLLAIDPTHRDALNNFLVLVADEAPEAALSQLEELERRNPEFSPIPAQMAVIYQKKGDLNKASEKMFRAVDMAPENMTYRYNLAILMDKQKNYEEAARLYQQILEAAGRGEVIPGNVHKIQERLTFIRSNRP
jgi:tetratricopeptide (TPR) repeat protein